VIAIVAIVAAVCAAICGSLPAFLTTRRSVIDALYFDVMRIPILAGRQFDSRDNSAAPPRVVVSESLAARLFAFEQPVGRQVRLGPTAQLAEVIGVVGDVKHRALEDASSETVYLSAWQSPSL
jgi:hypothetical protein